MKQVSVYLDGYSFDCRPRNSDWSYVERKMPRISQWAPDVRFVRQMSRTVMLRANFRALRAAVGRRIGMSSDLWSANTDRLDEAELMRSGCDIVFSHREFPLNCGIVPTIWMNAIVDPEMTRAYFNTSQIEFDREVAIKGRLFRMAAAVQVCTDAEAKRHAKTFPEIADRFVAVPLFGPHLRAAPESILDKHRNPAMVKLLFVGNAVKMKGLLETIDAYVGLPENVQRHASLTIVSHFDRASVVIPKNSGITVHRGLPQGEVIALMNSAHVLVNVSHFESYGMVFPEAMSQGMLCIGPDWEVQRELFDYGRAGVNVRCETNILREVMYRAIEDETYRTAIAIAGWRRFNERYAPEVVARQYANLFRSVASRSGLG